MASVGGIAAVQARIASIQSRAAFASTRVNGPLSLDVGGPTDPTAGFDPFGAAYQEAMAVAGIVDTTPGDGWSGSADGHDHGAAASGAGAGAPAVYGTGAIAAFTPQEFASISGGAAGGTSAASAGSVASGTEPTGASAARDAMPAPDGMMASRSAMPQPTINHGAATAASLLLDAHAPLTGPVYTGGSRLGVSSVSGWSAPRATSWSGVTGAPGSSVGRVGGYGSIDVPIELEPYANGRVGGEVLESIGQGGHRLAAPAAAAWRSAVAAAAVDGIDLRVTDSYRTFDQQVDLAARKGLYRDGGYAAVPGTSNHGWGLAVDADVSDPATLSWLRENGWRFGFVEAVPREPWHWEFRPEQA